MRASDEYSIEHILASLNESLDGSQQQYFPSDQTAENATGSHHNTKSAAIGDAANAAIGLRSPKEKYQEFMDAMDIQPSDEPKYQIENMVCTMTLGVELNLKDIQARTEDVELVIKRFPSLIIRLEKPNCTVSMFASGKMICTGAKTMEDAQNASKMVVQRLINLGYTPVLSGFRLQNVVASCCMPSGMSINISSIASDPFHGQYCDYDPDKFPGNPYRVKLVSPTATSLIFRSGKFVIIGCKSVEDVKVVFDYLVPILYQYRTRPKVPACDTKSLMRFINEKGTACPLEPLREGDNTEYVENVAEDVAEEVAEDVAGHIDDVEMEQPEELARPLKRLKKPLHKTPLVLPLMPTKKSVTKKNEWWR